MKEYKVVYQDYSSDEPKEIIVKAHSSYSAYLTAMDRFGWAVYGAYVEGFYTKDGRYHYFKNEMGNAY